MFNRRRCAPLLAVAFAVVGATACSPRAKIGIVLPETGAAAVYGASIRTGIALAFDAHATGADTRIEVTYRDSASDPPQRAAGAAEALFEQGVDLIIGGVTSSEAKAMIPVADRWRRVLLSPSASDPALGRLSRWFFRIFPSDELEGVSAANLVAASGGGRRVLIFQQDNDYTRGLLPIFVEELGRRGGRVVDSLRIDETGWERGLHRLLDELDPTAAYVCGYGDAIIASVGALRAASFRGLICTTSAITTASLLERAGATLDGVVFPLIPFDPAAQTEPVRGFVARYRTIYNLQPDIYAALGYDAATTALRALTGARSKGKPDLPDRLRELGPLDGLFGRFRFDDQGGVRRTLTAHWVHHGRVEPWPLQAARQP